LYICTIVFLVLYVNPNIHVPHTYNISL
jgi:hypothetical protein